MFDNHFINSSSCWLQKEFSSFVKTDPFPVVPTTKLLALAGLKGKRVGFIVSNKLGQSRKEILTNLQDEFIKKGYSTGVIVVDFLNINSINCMDFDILVSTICPRVALDERAQYSRPILSTVEALEFIKKPDSFDKKFTFDQIL